MSSPLFIGLVSAGLFSIWLGVVHIWVPRLFAYREAIGPDGSGLPHLGEVRLPGWTYRRVRSDLVGLTWVMSNAASYVLLTIGIVDLAWAAGDRSIPLAAGSTWIAGWWTLRAVGQFVLGRRALDVAMVALFIAIACGHLVLAVTASI